MPQSDLVQNSELARRPCGGDNMANTNNNTNCSCGCGENTYPGYWMPPNCPPPLYPEYPYPCPPVNTGTSSTEAQIAKLAKKSSVIRKMISNLTQKNKSIVISIGQGATYNFGCYLDGEGTETEYGTAILEILQAELDAIKVKITELTADLEAETETESGLETTVTSL